jgi:NAD(P)-dependent dehydrogenase (short-subunit alcohol dehydrogenase family)
VGVTAQLGTVAWKDWDWALAVNVSGVFSGVHTFLPRMLAHGEGGHLVATSSSAGLLAGSLGVYATTKYAVMGMFESLRAELDGRNIGVSVFCPGLVRSAIVDSGRNRQAEFGGKVKSEPPKLNPGAPQVDIMASAMDPDEAGRYVLAGVRRNDLFILSHPEFLPAVKVRSAVMAASFSKKPVPAARAAVTKLFTPVIYAEEAAKLRRAKPARSPARSKRRRG